MVYKNEKRANSVRPRFTPSRPLGGFEEHELVLTIFDFIFVSIYVIESILKLIVHTPQLYFKNMWNVFDLCVVFGSVCSLIMFLSGT